MTSYSFHTRRSARSGAQKLLPRKTRRSNFTYPVERNGVTHYVELPWITGVMADLSGSNADDLPDIGDRVFEEVNADNFNDYLKSQKPRARFAVENLISGSGLIEVDMMFESLSDFRPDLVARMADSETEELTITRELISGSYKYHIKQDGPISIAMGESTDSLDKLTNAVFVSEMTGINLCEIEVEWQQNPDYPDVSTLRITRKGSLAKLLYVRNRLKHLLDDVRGNCEARTDLAKLLENRELMSCVVEAVTLQDSCGKAR